MPRVRADRSTPPPILPPKGEGLPRLRLMPLKLVFLGRLEDAAGGPEREIAAVSSFAEVVAALEPELSAALAAERIRLAVNGTLVRDRGRLELRDGDELAFLPPVSGG